MSMSSVFPRLASLPKTVDGPVISRSSSWVGIPELHLEHLSLDLRAASILDRCLVMTAQRSQRAQRANRRNACKSAFCKAESDEWSNDLQ